MAWGRSRAARAIPLWRESPPERHDRERHGMTGARAAPRLPSRRGTNNSRYRTLLMRVAMIGAGYVGLVSGACFADLGHIVTCVDKDAAKIDALRNGKMPIYEPGLAELVARNVDERRLSFTTTLADAVANAAVVFIAVGTPSRPADGLADLTYVYQAAREIAHALRAYAVIVTKSTVPVGTGDEIQRIMADVRPEADLSVVYHPDFLHE